MLRQPDCRKPWRPDPRMNGASRPALIRAEGRPLAKPPLAVRGQSSGKSHLLMARRAGQLRIRQRIPGGHAWPWIPSPAREQSSARRRRAQYPAHDGGSLRVSRRGTSFVGQAMASRSAGGGQALDRDRGAWREGSAMVAGGIAFAHIRTIPVSCRLCSGPPAFAVNPRWGYARQKIQENSISVFLLRAGHFPSRNGALESAARCLRQIEFSRICAE